MDKRIKTWAEHQTINKLSCRKTGNGTFKNGVKSWREHQRFIKIEELRKKMKQNEKTNEDIAKKMAIASKTIFALKEKSKQKLIERDVVN